MINASKRGFVLHSDKVKKSKGGSPLFYLKKKIYCLFTFPREDVSLVNLKNHSHLENENFIKKNYERTHCKKCSYYLKIY